MILTVRGLVGEAGDMGGIKKLTWSYDRSILLILASLAGLMALAGMVGVGYSLYASNHVSVLVSLLIAAAGIYLALGIIREALTLDMLSKHLSEASEEAQEKILKSMLEENSKSIFALVELLLNLLAKILGGKSD